MDMDALRYPVGKFVWSGGVTEDERRRLIAEIRQLPAELRAAVAGLSESQLDTPYRPDGWTVRQVVHHLADSHINSYVRFRLALTEQGPAVKAYYEDRWAELLDARTAPVGVSLALLDALHQRWAMLLASLTPADWARTFRHPERGMLTLELNLALYAWHGRHHVAHITALGARSGWASAARGS